MTSVAPFAIFFVGALLVALTRGTVRQGILLLIPVIGALNLYHLGMGVHFTWTAFDYTMVLGRVDKLSLLFGYLFHLAAFIGVIYSLHLKDTTQSVAAIAYAGSALGAVFAGDLITFFVFWELLTLSSVFLILARRTPRARQAAMRYLLAQIGSGVILLAGIAAHVSSTGSIGFDKLSIDTVGGLLIFIAIGIKCGFPFLHNWLVDAYPEATPSGTVFLSAFTTKVAVYALARSYAGTEVLVYIGATMTMFPIFYAVIENDLRRVLAYSMINQIGFMVTGIGIGTALAVDGAVAHAFNDVIFKGLLFMSMGAVLLRTGKVAASDLGGLYKSMPKTATFCIVGAASISALPLFAGFVSKSMVMVAALEQGHPWVWLALLFASAGVMEHAGIKIPFFAFYAHDSGIRCKEAPRNMLIAMAIGAAICIFNGSYPWVLYSMLPFPVDYSPYTWSHVLVQCQLLFFSALAFCFLKLTGLYPPELHSVNIDADWTYRRLLPRATRAIMAFFQPIDRAVRQSGVGWVVRFLEGVSRHHGPQGALARTWPVGSTVLWVAVLLCITLVFYYFV